MSLLILYLFLIQAWQKVVIGSELDNEEPSVLDTSCIMNHCGTRDSNGIVTICEETINSDLDDCPSPKQVSPQAIPKPHTTFCTEQDGKPCNNDVANHKKGRAHKPIKNKKTIIQVPTTTPTPIANSFSNYNDEVRAKIFERLLELRKMTNHGTANWPTDTYVKSVDDTLYHVVANEDCNGESKGLHDEGKYSHIRSYIQQQIKRLGHKHRSLAQEQYDSKSRRKRDSPRYVNRMRRPPQYAQGQRRDYAYDPRNSQYYRQRPESDNYKQRPDSANYNYNNHIDGRDQAALQNLYGRKVYNEHKRDFEQVGKMGQDDHGAVEHKIPEINNHVNENMDDIIDDARMNAVNEEVKQIDTEGTLDSVQVKSMLKELLSKLDEIEHDPVHTKTVSHGHCNIHGLWLSTVAGAAIELLPDGNGVINTKIVDLPQPPEGALINGQWTGTGMVSKESPTTITIVFQEHIQHNAAAGYGTEQNDDSMQPPRTAVFVGQCLVCDNSPMLQGTWILFPNTQNCFPLADKSNAPESDIMYQIRRRRNVS